MDGPPVITCEQLDELIASRIEAEPPRTRHRAEQAHSELIMASRAPQAAPEVTPYSALA